MIKFLKITGFVFAIIIVLLICFFAFAKYKFKNIKDTDNLESLIDKNCNQLIINKKVVGFSIGILKDNQIYISNYGFADVENNIKIDSSTIFEIGSISKVFTTDIAQILANKNIINWNNDIIDYYPIDCKPKINDKTKLIHLATHTSGFCSIPLYFENKMLDECNPYGVLNINCLKEYLKNPTDKLIPNIKKIEYSNLGNGLLGHILEWKTNKSYEELLQTEICSKLKMKNTSLTVKNKEKFATGYDEKRNKTCHWDLPIMYSAGAIRSNITDMMKFAQANLGNSALTKSFQETQKVVYKTNDGAICKGWFVNDQTDLITGVGKIISHNGGTGGFSSYIALVPEKNVGIVILANQSDVNHEIEKLGNKFLLLAQKISFKTKHINEQLFRK